MPNDTAPSAAMPTQRSLVWIPFCAAAVLMVAPQFPLAEFRVDPMSGCQAGSTDAIPR